MSTSTSPNLLNSSMACATSCAAPSPCTFTGSSMISTHGCLLRMMRTMSLMAAPVGDVTTPTLLGNCGSGLFRDSSNRPSLDSFLFSSSNASWSEPSPPEASRRHNWYCLRLSRRPLSPARLDGHSVLHGERELAVGLPEHHTPELRRLVLQRKYMWPDVCSVKFETSPLTTPPGCRPRAPL
jgi:hypothetical protein